MKKVFLIFICTVLLFALSACDNSNKKMKGFTYEELAEYLSSVDGLVSAESEEEFIIPCGEEQLYIRESVYLIRFQTRVFPDHVFTLKKYYSSERFSEYGGYSDVPIDYHKVLSIDPYSVEDSVYVKSINYLGGFPSEFAYYLYECNFKSSPHWTEWVQYHIPRATDDLRGIAGSHGQCNELWYNPSSEQFEHVVYVCEKENETEVYIIYQEMCMFHSLCGENNRPYLISESLFEEINSEFPDDVDKLKKGTVAEFSNWFMGEYMDEIPPAFEDIKDEYVYYGTDGLYSKKFLASEYNDPTLFYEDMKTLGVNFDELRSYIIKATVPHDGTIQDIFWELIG